MRLVGGWIASNHVFKPTTEQIARIIRTPSQGGGSTLRQVTHRLHIHMKLAFVASLFIASFACAAAPLAMPERIDGAASVPVELVRNEVTALNMFVGSYPPRIASEEERVFVYERWSKALQNAWLIEAMEPESESTLALLSDLYRQGHNLDVKASGTRADQTIAKCLLAFPSSVDCHFSAAYFHLSVNPAFAPKGEASLIRLRELLKPEVNLDVERGFVFAYLYQGRSEEALQQVDYFLTLDPESEWARQFREAMASGKVTIEHR